MRARINRRFWFSSTGLLLLAGCENSNQNRAEVSLSARQSDRLPFPCVCTTGLIAELVQRIGGDAVDVFALMGPGVDPHLYKASPRDVSALYRAELVVASGFHLEGKLSDLLHRLSQIRPVNFAAEILSAADILHSEENAPDPHVWFDAQLWATTTEGLGRSLAAFDPPRRERYLAAADDFANQLRELDGEIRQQLATIAAPQRVLVTAHDAFGYFGRAYGLEVRGIQGISTESEAGLYEVNRLIQFLVERQIRAVFVESSVADRNLHALLEGCRALGHEVRIGGTLYSDALGPSGTPADNYLGMLRHNVRTIVEALR